MRRVDGLTQLNAIKDHVNSDAAGANRAAVTKIVGVIQPLIDAADISDNADNWLAANGFDIGEPAAQPIAQAKIR